MMANYGQETSPLLSGKQGKKFLISYKDKKTEIITKNILDAFTEFCVDAKIPVKKLVGSKTFIIGIDPEGELVKCKDMEPIRFE